MSGAVRSAPAVPGAGAAAPGRILYKTEFDKGVLISNFEKRGWEREEGDDWNFFWATKETTRSVFNPGAIGEEGASKLRLNDRQMINHFPNHLEITRKDNLAKNCKRYRKEMEREGVVVPEIVPLTFQLPQEYTLFVDYAARAGPNACWIAKPVGKSQGQGIFLFTKLSRIRHLQPSSEKTRVVEPHVVSRYIHNPLLVGGKKFDLRTYALVTSYKPLKLWLYREGFARFCNVKYKFSLKEKDLENSFMHLTNVAIQKHNDDYNDSHGGKWSLKNLRLFLEATRGAAATEQCFRDMELLIYHACKAVAPVMLSDRHCFEMYGFDLMIDETLKPWLLEVNGSPSLTYTTENDRLLKYSLINDTLDIVMPQFADSVLQKLARRKSASATATATSAAVSTSKTTRAAASPPRRRNPRRPASTDSGGGSSEDEGSDVDPVRDALDGEDKLDDDEPSATPAPLDVTDAPARSPLSTPPTSDVPVDSSTATAITTTTALPKSSTALHVPMPSYAAASSVAASSVRMCVGSYDLLCDEVIGIDPFTRVVAPTVTTTTRRTAAAATSSKK